MSCYRPIGAYRNEGGGISFHRSSADGKPVKPDVWIPCGMCIGCRAKRASDWSLRCMHEAAFYDANCFITLTYARDCLPPGASLEHGDFQRFMKRLRKHFGFRIRYFMCGEYGPLHQRPHYHAVLFGVDFRSDRVAAGKSASGNVYYGSPTLESIWTHGGVSVQDLTRETAGYCARYVMKKLLGPAAKSDEARAAREWTDAEGEVHERVPEYACMSLKPGIGSEFFFRYGSDIYPHDFIVEGGRKERPPKYYDKLLKRADRFGMADLKEAREGLAKLAHADNTEDRLRVREIVYEAKVRNQSRSLE